MRFLLTFVSCLASLSLSLTSQHCGGCCEQVHGPKPFAAHPKYGVTLKREKTQWGFRFSYHWREGGKVTHPLQTLTDGAMLGGFGIRKIFASPAGNGFLVTGSAYTTPRRRGNTKAMLAVFCDPRGKHILELPIADILQEQERKMGPCPNCGADCHPDLLYVFAKDPALSKNRAYVDLELHKTGRIFSVFLPLGIPVLDKARFDSYLAAADWARTPKHKRASARKLIDQSVAQLCSDKTKQHTQAAASLQQHGYLARSALASARDAARDTATKKRLASALECLPPFGSTGWEAITRDLGLLTSLLSYPKPRVARIARAQVGRIVPKTRGLTPAATITWLAKHDGKLQWDAKSGTYKL